MKIRGKFSLKYGGLLLVIALIVTSLFHGCDNSVNNTEIEPIDPIEQEIQQVPKFSVSSENYAGKVSGVVTRTIPNSCISGYHSKKINYDAVLRFVEQDNISMLQYVYIEVIEKGNTHSVVSGPIDGDELVLTPKETLPYLNSIDHEGLKARFLSPFGFVK